MNLRKSFSRRLPIVKKAPFVLFSIFDDCDFAGSHHRIVHIIFCFETCTCAKKRSNYFQLRSSWTVAARFQASEVLVLYCHHGPVEPQAYQTISENTFDDGPAC